MLNNAIAEITVSPTVDTAAYATGDLIGGLLTFTLPSGFMAGAIVQAVRLTDLAKQSAAIDLVLFSGNLTGTTLTDNAAFDPADAVLPTYIGHISIPAANYAAFNDSSAAVVKDGQLYLPPTSAGAYYGVLVSRGTPTFSVATDVKVTLVLERRGS